MQARQFNFWQDHSMHFLEMAYRHDHRETLANPDGFGKKTGDCGDTVAFYIKLDDARIQDIGYQIDGCINTNACANTVVHLARGRTLDNAWKITPEAIIDYLETLPTANAHCAELAVGAFYLALADCRRMNRQPWKKAYRAPHRQTI